MNEIGRKLFIIRKQSKLSLRQVQRLTAIIADRYGDKTRQVSASWLGRIERESHSIAYKKLESLEEAYGISHGELAEEATSESEDPGSPRSDFYDIPIAVLRRLDDLGDPLLPPEDWLVYFPRTTILPPLSQGVHNDRWPVGKRTRGRRHLYGVLGASDNTLVPFVQPGAIVEIDPSIRIIDPRKAFHSIFERPIYFLHSHDGYHCGWCDLDAEGEWLTLVPSAMTPVPQQRWRYRRDVEIVGLVNRVLTRWGFPALLGREHESFHKGPI